MHIKKQDLDDAVKAGVIEEALSKKLWTFLSSREGIANRPSFDLTNLLWYAGALIVISAMGLFSTEAFSRWGGSALAVTALVYGAVFAYAGEYFWRVRHIFILGGLLITVAVSMAPLATYGLQDYLGWWTHGDPGDYRDFFTWVRGSWVFMSLSAIAAGLIALKLYRFPFIMMIIAFALWFLSMDITPWFVSDWPDPNEEYMVKYEHWERLEDLRGIISTLYGVALLIIAWGMDVRTKASFSFWLHFAAALCITGGMLWIAGNGYEWAMLCAVSVIMLLISIFLQRSVYTVFGGIGVASYLGYLSFDIFDDVLIFSFVLSGIGVLIMFLGYLYFKHQRDLQAWLERKLPRTLSRLRPKA
jgi:hypothetical protein